MLNFSKSMVVIVLIAIVHFYFYFSSYVEKLDYKLYDLSTQFFDEVLEKKNATYSVVVDIDEESLETFGQWPWSRVITAELIKSINKMSPSAIGINILKYKNIALH